MDNENINEKISDKEIDDKELDKVRRTIISYDNMNFAKLIMNDLKMNSNGRKLLKKYKQSEVRDIIENFRQPKNQEILMEISKTLYGVSPHYKRLVKYFSGMPLFAHVISPFKNIRSIDRKKASKQYIQMAELLSVMNIRHEMKKVLRIAFTQDVFFGYVHRDKTGFYIQEIDTSIAKITSIEDGIFNFSIDMNQFKNNEKKLDSWADEVKEKYYLWKKAKSKDSKISPWVELSAENTICIKINEEMIDIFPPFAGSFDAIYDLDGFKKLRKDKEELGNYMMLTQTLPIRENSEDNNDFLIDSDTMMYFHNLATEVVPDNVGVITSPMKIEPVKFDKDKFDNDGVYRAERDFWGGNGTSQQLFSTDKTTSQGLQMSVKTDEQIVFDVLRQIERWVNRFLKFEFGDLFYMVKILNITYFNKEQVFKMYMEAGQYGFPVKRHIGATLELDPIEVIDMAYLENDLLGLGEDFIPLQSSHTQSGDDKSEGAPAKDDDKISDETARHRDKPNS